MSRPSMCMPMALAALLLLAGCSGYRTYRPGDFDEWPPQAGAAHERIKVGDRLRVMTHGAERIDGDLEAIGRDAMVVAGRSVPYESVASLQVKAFLWQPTAVVAGAAIFWVAIRTRDGSFSPDRPVEVSK